MFETHLGWYDDVDQRLFYLKDWLKTLNCVPINVSYSIPLLSISVGWDGLRFKPRPPQKKIYKQVKKVSFTIGLIEVFVH